MARRTLRLWLGFGASGLIALVIAALGGAYIYLNSDSGRRFLVERVEAAARSDSLSLQIGRLEGSPTSAFTLHDIALSDGSGVFARVGKLAVEWRPAQLLLGRLVASRIAAADVVIDRLPPATPTEPDSGAGTGPGIDLVIGSFSVDSLRLGPAIVGEPVQLTADGSAALESDGTAAELRLDARRIDGVGGRARLALELGVDPARFSAAAEIEEPSGGQIVRLLDVPGHPALSLHLDGTGPANDWRGTLRIAAGEMGATADLSVAVRETGLTVGVKGDARVAPLLPGWLVPLTGKSASYDIALAGQWDREWRVERLALESGSLRVDGSGRYDMQRQRVMADAVIAALDGLSLQPDLRAKEARVVLHAAGPIAQPRASATVSGRGIEFPGAAAGALYADLRLSGRDARVFSFDGRVEISELDPGTTLPPGLVGDVAEGHVEGTLTRDGDADVSRLELRSGPLTFMANGQVTAKGAVNGAYEVALARLGPIAESAGLSPEGSIRIAGPFRFDRERRSGAVEIDGTLSGLAKAETPPAALVGSQVPLKAVVSMAADGRIELRRLNARFAAGVLQGEGTLAPKGGPARGQVEFDAPDLGPFSALAGTPLAGRGKLRVELSGRPEKLAGNATLQLDRPAGGGLALDGLEIRADAVREGAKTTGKLALSATSEGNTVPGALRFSADGKVLKLTEIVFGEGSNRVTGNIDVGFSDNIASGALTARFGDLSALPMLPVQAEGAADLSIRLARGGGQRIVLAARGRDLRISPAADAALAIGAVSIDATVENAFAAPAIRGAVRLDGLRHGDASLNRFVVTVRNAGTQTATFEGRANGQYRQPFALVFAGRAAREGEAISAILRRVEGTLAEASVRTVEPLRLTWRNPSDWSGRAAFRIGAGAVSASTDRKPDRIDARLDTERLPMALLAAFATDPGFDGVLSAQLALAGPPEALHGRATLDIRGLQPRDGDWAAEERFTVSAAAALDGSRLSFWGRMAGSQDTAIDWRAETPLRLAVADSGFSVSAGGTLRGAVGIKGQLSLLERLVALGENRVAGTVNGRVELGGTVEAPQATGRVAVSGGSIENIQLGTTVRDLSATLSFDGTQLRVAGLHGRDAGDGQIRGTGTVRLNAAAGWPIDVSLSFAQFAAVARDDATLHASGDLRFQGTMAEPRIVGNLRLDGAELRIPDQLGGGAPALDVIEVNVPPGMRQPAAAKAGEQKAALSIPLDLTIDAPGRIFVRGRGLDSEWKGDMKVSGTTAKPIMVGKLSVVRGGFAFAGRTFNLREGEATFQGGSPPDPALAVRAVASVPSIEAAIVVSGTASNPKIELQSTPPLPNDEILSRILFGKSFGQLNAIQAAQLAQSAAQLSGGPSSIGVLDRIRRTIGVDVLNVGPSGESGNGASLQAGKYITEDVFVTIDQGTTPGSQKVGVEIKVTPNITVETDVGPEAGSSVGVNWKWDY